MCEDSGILLVSTWVCRNLTILDVILCKCWVVEYKSVLCIKSLIDCSKSLLVAALILTDVWHDSESLWLDEDLTFLALLGSHLLTVCIVSSEEPVAVPCWLHDVGLHLVNLSLSSISLSVHSKVLKDSNVVRTCICEECSNHNWLSNLWVSTLSSELRVGVCLEALTWCIWEAWKVDTIVPVSSHCKWKSVWSKVVHDLVEWNLEVVKHRLCNWHIVVIWNHLVKDAPVASLLDISWNWKDQP